MEEAVAPPNRGMLEHSPRVGVWLRRGGGGGVVRYVESVSSAKLPALRRRLTKWCLSMLRACGTLCGWTGDGDLKGGRFRCEDNLQSR